MDILNDDCQLRIIKLLELKDQLNLYEATKDGKDTKRMASNVRFTWERQRSFCLNKGHFDSFNKRPELFHDFLSIISPTVHQLRIEDVTANRYGTIRFYSLPISQTDESSKEQQIHNKNLREEHFKIFVNLPKLQKLSISHGSERLNCISEIRGKDIEKITFNRVCSGLLRPLGIFINVRQMTFVDSLGTTSILEESITSFPLLERLDILEDQIFTSEIDFWQTVTQCPALKILNIPPLYLR